MSAYYESLFPTDMWSNTTPFFRVHERVLPCIHNSIENNKLRSPSDWFFSMTFDFEMAKRTSIAMCKKLKSIKSDNLQTIHSQIFNVYLQRVLQTNLTLKHKFLHMLKGEGLKQSHVITSLQYEFFFVSNNWSKSFYCCVVLFLGYHL